MNESSSGQIPTGGLTNNLEDRFVQIEKLLKDLNRRIDKKCYGDNLMMTRIREELDMMINIKKEERIVLTGLTNTNVMPTDLEAKKKWLHKMVGQVFNTIDNTIKGKILFVNHGKRLGRDSNGGGQA